MGAFTSEKGWMQRASLASNVLLGFEWEATRAAGLDYSRQKLTLSDSWEFLQHGLLYGLFCSGHRPRLHPLDQTIDTGLPLLVASASAMSEKAQKNIIRFVQEGGHAILMGALPETDLDYSPCTLLKDFVGNPVESPVVTQALVLDVPELSSTVYNMNPVTGVAGVPEGGVPIAWETRKHTCMGYRMEKGSGSITWLGLQFMTKTFEQVHLLEQLLARGGARPLIDSTNRNVMTTLWEGQGKHCLFVMNLYASPQETDLTLWPGSPREKPLGQFRLAPMEVQTLVF